MKKKADWVKEQRVFFDNLVDKEKENEDNWKNDFLNPSIFIRRRDEDFLKFGMGNCLKDGKFLTKNLSILDVGSGRGDLTLFLLQKGFKVSALDISKKSLEVLEKRVTKLGLSRGLKKIIFGTLEDNIDKIRNSFDYVVCYNFLHHVSDIEGTIDLMGKAAKPGGSIVFIEPNGKYPLWRFYRSESFFQWEYEKGTLNCFKRNFENILRRKEFKEFEILPICFFPARVINRFPNLTRILDDILRRTFFSSFSTGIMGKAKKPI